MGDADRKSAFNTYTIKELIFYLSYPYLEINVVMLSQIALLSRPLRQLR